MSDISIRQLSIDDWQLFKQMRLKALKNSPGVFGSKFEEALEQPESYWKSSVADSNSAIFIIFDDGQPVGLTAIAIDRNDAVQKKQAILWASWLEPEYRGKGISKQMYEARLDWARRHPTCEKIVVGHRASNIASKKAILKHGFTHTKTDAAKSWPDGTIDDGLDYELHLNKAK